MSSINRAIYSTQNQTPLTFPVAMTPSSGVCLSYDPLILEALKADMLAAKKDVDFPVFSTEGVLKVVEVINDMLLLKPFKSCKRVSKGILRTVSEGKRAVTTKINFKVLLEGTAQKPLVIVTLRPSSKLNLSPFSNEDHKFGGSYKVRRFALLWIFTQEAIWSSTACTLTNRVNFPAQLFKEEIEKIRVLNILQDAESKNFVPKLLGDPICYFRSDQESMGLKLACNLQLFNQGDLFEVLQDLNISCKTTKDLKDQKLPFPLLPIFLKVAEAIDFFHRHGYVYGDMKPENILFHREENLESVALTDFGFLYPINRKPPEIAIGTMSYASPEVLDYSYACFRNDFIRRDDLAKNLTPYLDCWSFGCSLYVMLTKFALPWHELIDLTFSFFKFRSTVLLYEQTEEESLGYPEESALELKQKVNDLIVCLKTCEPYYFAKIEFGINPFTKNDAKTRKEFDANVKLLFIQVAILNREIKETYQKRVLKSVLGDEINRLQDAFFAHVHETWKCLEKVKKPSDPMAKLLWSLIRPDFSSRISSKQALNEIQEIITLSL